MNKAIYYVRRAIVAVLLLSATGVAAWAANTKTTVSQVTTTVTLSDDVDYIVTGATPFGTSGMVNITNTEHAVLILAEVKPSKVISTYLKNIQINGEAAKDNSNCMVKLYNRGAIILPYSGGDKFKPLTVYSEPNFQGETANNFGLENSGGYMNSLTAKQLNNKIRSFKLKRGYMVTFSLKAGGRGYSRCFIAADKDLEMASLPALMDRSISSYRVFKWYDTGKKNLASDTRSAALSALKVQSCYDWGQGNATLLPDYEWVPNHIYEDYPSSSTIGKATWSPHTKNNNEPFNSSDDNPQDLNTILNNWENMMRTGLRLCSPASHDGALTQHHAFLDSIDARGWRCDIIDLHCYWPEWNFYNQIKGPWVDRHHRPVWISEWVWGSSWGNQGIFSEASDRNNPTAADYQKNKEVVERICKALNSYDYIERYYYWNSEANCSKIYRDDKLTPAGEMYAALDGGVGYNGKYDYVPNTPRQYAPTGLEVVYDKTAGTATLKWHEYNGEMNGAICVERSVKASGNNTFEVIDSVDIKELEADYTYTDSTAASGYRYRIQVLDGKNTKQYSSIVMAVSDEIEAGDPYPMGDEVKFIGGNVFPNGDFALGTYGWMNGKGEPIGAPYFQAIPVGGKNNDAYLQAYGDGNQTSEQSLVTSFDADQNADYYFSGTSCKSTLYTNLSETSPSKSSSNIVANLRNETANWTTQMKTFTTSANYEQLTMTIRSAKAEAQVGQLFLARLFATQDSAINDGIAKIRLRAEAFKDYNTDYAFLNTDLDSQMAAITDTDLAALKKLTALVSDAISALGVLRQSAPYVAYVEKLVALELYNGETLQGALDAFRSATTIEDVLTTSITLSALVDEYMPLTSITGKIKQPKFTAATGWTTKCGTYTGGDQKVNKVDNVSFWNAWWSGIPATDLTQTMAVKQEVTGLDHGLYSLECKASTEHFCLSDQHGYIAIEGQQENTPVLTADYMDLPSVSKEDRWQALLSAPVYVGDGGTVTIGFESSKKGAMDNMWREVGNTASKGDQREGWWGATDFALKFSPLYMKTVEPNQWGTICLPYAVRPGKGMKFYQIVAVNPAFTELCLEEIQETQAGVPCLYRSETADGIFLEYGKAMGYTIDGMGNLRGYLKTSGAKVPLNYYVLNNGEWTKVTDNDNRPLLEDYSAAIRPLTDTSSKAYYVTDHWTELTMPIHGVTEEEKEINALGIVLPSAAAVGLADGYYTLDGRSTVSPAKGSLRPGLYIKVVNGRAFKTVVK